MNCQDKLIIALIALTLMNPVYADDLGRLFTSPDERRELGRLRYKSAWHEVEHEPKVLELEDIPDDVIEHDVITLDGIVYRGDGKSTAWINKTNTYDGNIQLYYMQVSKEDIEPDGVTITLLGEASRVKLKVGDDYDPNTSE